MRVQKAIFYQLTLGMLADVVTAGEKASKAVYPIWDVDDFVAFYQREVAMSQLILLAGGVAALLLLGITLFRLIRGGRRFQFSLRWLLAFTCASGVALYGSVGWWTAEKPDPGDAKFKEAVNQTMERRVSVDYSEEDLRTIVWEVFGRHVNTVLSPEFASSQRTISLKLVDAPGREAIRRVCELIGASCDVRNGAILLYPKEKRPPIRNRYSPNEEWDSSAVKKLSRRVSLELFDTPLSEIIAFYTSLTNVPMRLDPALHAESLKIDFCPIRDMRLDDALTWCCFLAGAEWTLARSEEGVGEVRITRCFAAAVTTKGH